MAQATSREPVRAAAGPLWPRLVGSIPELTAVAVAGFSVAPMIALLAGAFHAALVIPLGLLGAGLATWICGVPAEPADRRTIVCTAVAVVIALAWFLYNVRYFAEDVYATRDPATYGIAGRWLVEHASLNVPVHAEVFGAPQAASFDASGFELTRGATLHAQGNHLLPALLALAGSAFGATALLQANVAISALAMIVFFGLARRVVGAPLALLVMTSLAVSMPFVYVSRDAYSEPLLLLFLMGGLALLHRAVSSGRVADYALAGLVAGCSALVRVDSYGALLAIVLAAIAVVAAAGPGGRRPAVARASALVSGAVAPLVLGWLDLTQLSEHYFHDLHRQIIVQLAALVTLLVVGPGLAWLAWRPTVRARLSTDATQRRLGVGAAIVVVAAFAFLASRPWWQVTRRSPPNVNLENMQRVSGVAVDGTRLYNEQSVNWQAMYLGWPTVVLAVGGYALLVGRLIRRRSDALVGTLAMGLIMSALYLWNCQIVADQPWASRRFVPVVIPLLLIAAAAALRALWMWRPGGAWVRAVAVVAGILMLLVPAAITRPMAHVRDEAGHLAQLRAICAAVGNDGAVLEMDLSTKDGYGQSIRSYCGVPTIALINAQPSQLSAIRTAAATHGRTLFLLSQDPATTRYAASGAVAPFSKITVQRWPNAINRAPDHPWRSTTRLFLSTVDAAGLAHPVPARR